MEDMKELGARLRCWAERFEDDSTLDGPARRLQATAAILVGSGRRLNFLRGQWLGHSFHPLLTDFPLGAWASASFLDLFGRKNTRPATEALVAAGLVAAIPTALAGLADWSEADQESQRVGVVHARLNSAVVGFYASSLVARRKEHHGIGVALGVCGGLLAWASGYLGGHLSLVRDAGHDSDHRRGIDDVHRTSSKGSSDNKDELEETASRDSFPASDPPAW